MPAGEVRAKKGALKIGATLYKDFTSLALTNEDGDDITFEEYELYGATQWTVEAQYRYNPASGSAWSLFWDSAGSTLDFIYIPEMNAVASDEQPHFSGTLDVSRAPSIGGDFSLDGYYVSESAFVVIGAVTKVTE